MIIFRDYSALVPKEENAGRVLFSMCLSLALVAATVSALNLALPQLAISLNASNTTLTWIADSYTIVLAALVLPLGALGDRLGRRNILIAGNIVFGAASLAAAFATSSLILILCRAVMGIGAAMIMPGTLSTITAVFPPENRAKAVATWSGVAAAGAIIGMLIAGLLLTRWGWESIFIISSVFAVFAAVSAILFSPNTKEEHSGRFDIVGAISLMAGIGGLVFAIIEGNDRGWTQSSVLASAALSIGGLIVYVLSSLKNDNPLVNPRLFQLRGFRAGSLTICIQFMAIFGFFFVGLQYLQLMLDYSPLMSALALVPVALIVLPVSQQTPKLVSRLGIRYVMSAGLFILALGLLWIARLEVSSGYLPFLVGLILASIGVGLTSSAGTTAIMSSLSANKQGVASALNDTTREVGASIGIALMGSVYSSHYRDALPSTLSLLPSQLASTIRLSAASGLEAAKHLGINGEPIKIAVKSAFMSGLSASLNVVAIIVIIAAIATLLRAPNQIKALDEVSNLPAWLKDFMIELKPKA